MRSRIWFPKGRALNAANTCPPYSYTSECSAVKTHWQTRVLETCLGSREGPHLEKRKIKNMADRCATSEMLEEKDEPVPSVSLWLSDKLPSVLHRPATNLCQCQQRAFPKQTCLSNREPRSQGRTRVEDYRFWKESHVEISRIGWHKGQRWQSEMSFDPLMVFQLSQIATRHDSLVFMFNAGHPEQQVHRRLIDTCCAKQTITGLLTVKLQRCKVKI